MLSKLKSLQLIHLCCSANFHSVFILLEVGLRDCGAETKNYSLAKLHYLLNYLEPQ